MKTPHFTGSGQRTLSVPRDAQASLPSATAPRPAPHRPAATGSQLRSGAGPPLPAASRSRSQAPLRRRLGTAPGITTPRAQTQGEGEGGQTERRAPGLPGPAGGPVPTQEAGGPGRPRASPADGRRASAQAAVGAQRGKRSGRRAAGASEQTTASVTV
ncbi:uncharacterized protein LOC110400062 isoform X2 [Numida meleagris]|uniref:uncharacterized protein LOC110400062 isoform X2 n=1 Tax=Numida meleagris TaxID=8996 RepID=UPI000B3E2B1D|nr:uncharacterized protein LOC110400062 isoform X2 [Numida meleagris]